MNETTMNSVGDTAVNADPTAPDFTVSYGNWSAKVADLPPKAIAYLLQNGFSQSMTDAAALSKDQKRVLVSGEGASAVYRDMTEEELEEKVNALREARYAKIIEGTIAVRTGSTSPKQTTLERTVHAVAVEMLKAALAKADAKLPTKDATITVGGKPYTREQLINAKINGKDKEAILAEAKRRMEAAQADSAELDAVL